MVESVIFNLLDIAITNYYIACYIFIVNALFHRVDIRNKRIAMDEPFSNGPSIITHHNPVLS